MSALTVLVDAGLQATIEQPDGLKLKGLSKLTTEQKNHLIRFAKTHKQAIIKALGKSGAPGHCESCPAAGYWDHAKYTGQGLLCFHYAYFIGKPGRPQPCSEMRAMCPRKDNST